MTDPIADMLTRIRNAQASKKAEIFMPYSKIKMSIAEILKRENYIINVREENDGVNPADRIIRINLKYKENKQPAILNLKKISKPGQRVYVGKDNLPQVLDNYGIAIISTSQGLMTNLEARKRRLGGELICEIY